MSTPLNERCGFIPLTFGYAPCTRQLGHDGPCAHPEHGGGEYTVNAEDFRVMLICTFRYSLGRKTYMSSLVPEWIRQHFALLTRTDIEIMISDIVSNSRRDGGLGMDMDAKHWLDLQSWLKRRIGQCQRCPVYAGVNKDVCVVCEEKENDGTS